MSELSRLSKRVEMLNKRALALETQVGALQLHIQDLESRLEQKVLPEQKMTAAEIAAKYGIPLDVLCPKPPPPTDYEILTKYKR